LGLIKATAGASAAVEKSRRLETNAKGGAMRRPSFITDQFEPQSKTIAMKSIQLRNFSEGHRGSHPAYEPANTLSLALPKADALVIE
jgi:hypothetical protein